jgi:hypothetical protein
MYKNNTRQEETRYSMNRPYRVDNAKNRLVVTRVKDVDIFTVKPPRGGVILYTVYNNEIYIGLGVDEPTHDLTDFAGGISYKRENIIEGSLREFREESLNIFQGVTRDAVQDCLVIYDNKNFVIFVPLAEDPNKISKVFNSTYLIEQEKLNVMKKENPRRRLPKLEVCGITWLTLNEFKSAIYQPDNPESPILYSRVKNFLRLAGEDVFSEL